MTRVTGPIPKLSNAFRSISTTASAARPSTLLESSARQAVHLPRRMTDLKHECHLRKLDTVGSKAELVQRLTAFEMSRDHSTTGGHRPSPASTTPTHIFRPLMQGFRSDAPKTAAHDSSSIDYMFFPEMDVEAESAHKLRVPLLPDNFHPDRSASSAHAVEALDEAVPRPEISIVASHPENVAPAALTEVVDNAALEADVGQLTRLFNASSEGGKEPGVVREVLGGMWDDMFGGGKAKKLA